MGYELHVHRADDWFDAEEKPITLDEWAAYVAASPDLRMEDVAEAQSPDGSVIRIEHEGMAVWTGHPDVPKAWITYSPGEIKVKSPDDATIRRMYEIASALGGRLQGDEGEFYDEHAQPLEAVDPARGSKPPAALKGGVSRFFRRG